MTDHANQKPRQLPRGPHALSRDEVVQAQRERLFFAMAECAATHGYMQTSVADVLALSGISRATFYQLFADKEDCFCAAYQEATRQLGKVLITTAAAGPVGPLERLDLLLGSYLQQLASRPAFARAFMVEVHAAGLRANGQRQAVIESFIDLVAATLEGRTGSLGSAEDQRFAVKLLVHGVISLVTSMIGTGDTVRLPELREPLMRLATGLMR